MPFTLAHPVAILPFARRGSRLPLSALVIGSMSPDFPYFLMVNSILYHFGHSLRGIFAFCLPASLVALLVFHYVVKFPLLSLLPRRHVERLLPVAKAFRVRSLFDAFLTVAAIILGAVSHIVVDSFTHDTGWSVRHLPFLAYPLPIYKALQYGGSVGGLWFLWHVYMKWYATAPANPDAAQRLQRLLRPRQVIGFLCVLLALSTALGIANTARLYELLGSSETAKKIFADTLETAMAAYALGLIGFGILWQVLAVRKVRANT